jgi:hypothetical protein
VLARSWERGNVCNGYDGKVGHVFETLEEE